MTAVQTKKIDPKEFRQALGTFMTGVTIVTSIDSDGNRRGFTANSFTSVSLDPPLISICVADNADAIDVFENCGFFSVNILSEDQQGISTTFATKEPNKFDYVTTRTESTGAPLIEGCIGWFDCVPFKTVEAGDHIILIGEVKAFGADTGNPLGYWRGGYVTLGMEATADRAEKDSATLVGSVLSWHNRLLMQRTPQGWDIPQTPVNGKLMGHDERIAWLLSALELDAETDFLYSVFESRSTGTNHIIYRGRLLKQPAQQDMNNQSLALYDEAEMPWSQLVSDEVATMIKRYFKEASIESFGIYADGLDGSVADLSGVPSHWKDKL
ncbi:MAG: flavin reductase family protein [Pseudomonadota bacterium]